MVMVGDWEKRAEFEVDTLMHRHSTRVIRWDCV